MPVSDQKAFDFFYNINNLERLMPEQVINWQSSEDRCSFDIKGMAHISLQRDEGIENRLVRIKSGPDNPIDLEFRLNFEKEENSRCTAWVELTAELSPMLQLPASGPMQNLVNIMAEKLQV